MPTLLRRSKSSNKFPPSNDEPKENSLIKRSILGWAFNHQFKSGGPFSPSDHPEHRIWGSVFPFRSPRASNLGGRFTLPTTPGIKFGGHFRLPGSSEVKFGAHSCIIDLSDTQIWAHSSIIDLSDTQIWAHSCITDLSGHQIWGSRSGGARGEESDFFPFSKLPSLDLFNQQKKLRACAAQSFHFS